MYFVSQILALVSNSLYSQNTMIFFEEVKLTNFDPPLKKFHDQTDTTNYSCWQTKMHPSRLLSDDKTENRGISILSSPPK